MNHMTLNKDRFSDNHECTLKIQQLELSSKNHVIGENRSNEKCKYNLEYILSRGLVSSQLPAQRITNE